jgi:hypothetical protein
LCQVLGRANQTGSLDELDGTAPMSPYYLWQLLISVVCSFHGFEQESQGHGEGAGCRSLDLIVLCQHS